VRPEHTMVGHTGFLVFARRIEHREPSMPEPVAETPEPHDSD